MEDHKQGKTADATAPAGGSIWNSLLHSIGAMLGSRDYLSSLTAKQIAALEVHRIAPIGEKIIELDPEGIELWSEAHISALTSTQLSVLPAAHAEACAGRAPLDVIERWITDTGPASLSRQIPAILNAVAARPEALAAIGNALSAKKTPAAATEVVLTILQIASDDTLAEIFSHVSPKAFKAMVASEVRDGLQKHDPFKDRLDADTARFVKARMGYQHETSLFRDTLEELDKYERRLELSQSKTVRERIYSEFQEWLHELPISGLARMTVSSGKVFRQSKGDQNATFRNVFSAIRNSIQQLRQDLEANSQLCWADLDALASECEHIKQLFDAVDADVEDGYADVEALSEKLQPLAKLLQDANYSTATLETVDALLVEAQTILDHLGDVNTDLAMGIDQVRLLFRGVTNAIESTRLSEEHDAGSAYIGALPSIGFARLAILQPKSKADKQALQKNIAAITDHPELQHLKPAYDLFIDLAALLEQMQETCSRLGALEAPLKITDRRSSRAADIEIDQPADPLLRCRYKIKAWQSLRDQVVKMTGTDD